MEIKHNFSDMKYVAQADILKNLKADLEYIIQIQVLFAQVTKAKYDALIANGFEKNDALFLCK